MMLSATSAPASDSSATVSENPLSKRETEVLMLVGKGMSNQDIAAQLYISVGTVKACIVHILEKLDVHDRTQAALIAFRKGWI